MKISFSPQVRFDSLVASKVGDTLTINDAVYDFSAIPDGATLPAGATDCEYIVGEIERVEGVLHLTLLLPIGVDASEAARFPEPLINLADGSLEMPQ